MSLLTRSCFLEGVHIKLLLARREADAPRAARPDAFIDALAVDVTITRRGGT
jgi:hypothetical protein